MHLGVAQQCRICENGTFCFSEQQFVCPRNSRSPPGSDNITDCVCIAGYHSTQHNHACQPCEAGTYCVGNESSTSCPPQSWSDMFSVEVADCFCLPGHTGSGGVCTACGPGTAKAGNGGAVCEPCGPDLFQGSPGADACQYCPVNTNTLGSHGATSDAACVSNAGYYSEDGTITPCAAGTFQEARNQTRCADCRQDGENVWFTTGAATVSAQQCQMCSAHSLVPGETSGSGVVSCQCEAGFVGPDGGDCTACAAGLVKGGVGSADCEPCPAHHYAGPGNVGCEPCTADSASPPQSEDRLACICNAGFEASPVSPFGCSECATGTYQVTQPLSLATCVDCAVGKFSQGVQNTVCGECASDTFQPDTGQPGCLACHSGSVSQEGSVACLCDLGHELLDGLCGSCKAGFHKDRVGNEACTQCLTGRTTNIPNGTEADCHFCRENQFLESRAGGVECAECGPNKVHTPGGLGSLSCECRPGFTLRLESCVACAPGKFKSAQGNHNCTRCPSGYTGADVGLHPAFAAYIAATGADPRLRDSENACQACAPGSYEQHGACVACHASSASPEGSSSVVACACMQGYEPAGGLCTACSAGSFKSGGGNIACTQCAANTYSSVVAAWDPSVCQPCPAGTAEASAARNAASNCVCKAGYEASSPGVACSACIEGAFKAVPGNVACEQCSAGTYQPLATGPHTSDTCKQCPDFSASVSGASLVSACVCSEAYHRNASKCVLCQANHFCPDQDAERQCPSFATSAPGSVSVTGCLCLPGFSRVQDVCKICPPNTYCPDGVQQRACPDNSTTLGALGTVNRSVCVCRPGFYESDSALGSCALCGVDSYCANEQQIACPHNSSSVRGSLSVDTCLCDALFRREGSACEQCTDTQVCAGGRGAVLECAETATNHHQLCKCAPGTYCSALDAETCLDSHACPVCEEGSYCADNGRTTCLPGSSAPAGSSTAHACTCVPGRFRTFLGACQVCDKDSYCFDEGTTKCTDLDTQLITESSGATSKAACVCAPGHFRLSPTDRCKPCPVNFYCPAESTAQPSNVYACLENEFTVATGSTEKAQCLCRVGFLMDEKAGADTKCLACAPGERCSGGGVVDEVCHIQSRVANAAHTKCLCLPGFSENHEMHCVACAAPSAKGEPGDFACDVCPVDTYWHNTTYCMPCMANASSTPGATACVCRAPQVLRDGACVACPSDTFYGGAGSCQACPAASTTAAANYEVLPAVRSCLCHAGFERVLLPHTLDRCEACAAGTYELDGRCVSCGLAASSAPGSSGIGACECNQTLCGVRVWDEFCAGGCEPALPPCERCEPGHFKAHVSAAGNSDPCVQCPLHTFQELPASTGCDSCHHTRKTPGPGRWDRAQCRCVPGFEHLPGNEACLPCVPGHFKSDLGDYNCSACAVGTFAELHNQSRCDRCDVHTLTPGANTTVAIASVSVTDCTCAKGYFGVKTEPGEEAPVERCLSCAVGSFKDSVGFDTCSFCGTTLDDSTEMHNTYGNEPAAATSHTHCIACPSYSGQDHAVVGALAPMQGVASCVCLPGFDSLAADGCDECAPHRVQLVFGTEACEYCADGFAFVTAFQACEQCTLHTVGSARVHVGVVINSLNATLPWATSTQDCACDLGYARRLDTCHACEVGSFRDAPSSAVCSPCALHSFQNTTASTSCHLCPPHSYTTATGSSTVRQCLCVAGYEWDDEKRLCVACQPGFVGYTNNSRCEACPVRTFSASAAQTLCTACAQHEFSLDPRDSQDTCACDPGYGSVAGLVCDVCARGSFSAGGTAASQRPECLDCPVAKNTTHTGNFQIDACVCEPGHGDAAENTDPAAPCGQCTSGRYAPGGANVACAKCGFGTVTEPELGAHRFDQCMCNAVLGLLLA